MAIAKRQPSEKSSKFLLKTEEKQLLLLKRQWELIETVKEYRIRIPIVSCTMLLATTGFVLNSETLPSSSLQAIGISLVLISLTAVSLWIAKLIQNQYDYLDERIFYLYDQLGMSGDSFRPDKTNPLEKASDLFRATYVIITVIGLLCSIGVLLAPVH